jgi:hypothetical protein
MTAASSGLSVSMTRRIREQRHGVYAASSGTGDTGDTLLKQTQSPPPAPPSGQEHAPAPGRTRGRVPARPLAPRNPPPEPPRCPVCPRLLPAHANPTQASRALCRPSAPASPTAPRHPCAAFCAASHPTPRNPRQSAGSSNPSPPTTRGVSFGPWITFGRRHSAEPWSPSIHVTQPQVTPATRP